MALPVIPLVVHGDLGYGNVLVGVSVGIQFLATVLTRGYAGRVADRVGASRSMRSGVALAGVAGLFYVAAALPLSPAARLATLLVGRLVVGFGESQLIVGALAWGIGIAGQSRSGTVLAWVGMAMYGSIAAGAPLGLWLNAIGGFAAIGEASVVLSLVGLAILACVSGIAPAGGTRASFWRIVGSIWRPGLGVALQGVGFAAIGAFVSLDFVSRGWPRPGLALTCFGLAFVLVRVVFGHLPDRIGGLKVALTSLLVESAGQAVLFIAPDPQTAYVGATLTGCGCSMVFPSFGVEIVRQVPAQHRGTALGGFAAFQDIAYGGTGPVAGLAATAFGYSSVFAIGTCAALGGAAVTWGLMRSGPAPVKAPG